MQPSSRLFVIAILMLAFAACLVSPSSSFAADERKIKQQVQPIYPELAKNMRLQGSVKLEIIVSPQGTVRSVKILGGHPLLADAAEQAVKKWKYDTGPEETRTVTIDFKQ